MTGKRTGSHALTDDMVPGWLQWREIGSTFDAFAYAELSLGKLMLASRLLVSMPPRTLMTLPAVVALQGESG